MEPDTFNSAVLNLLANVAKVSFLFYNTLFPRFWNHPQLRVGGGAEIWKGLPEEEEEGGLWSCKCEQTVSMATLDRFSLAAEPFAFGVLATDGLGLWQQLKIEGLEMCLFWGICSEGLTWGPSWPLKLSTSSAQPCHLQTLISVDQLRYWNRYEELPFLEKSLTWPQIFQFVYANTVYKSYESHTPPLLNNTLHICS